MLLVLVFTGLSCIDHEFTNPADPGFTLLPPTQVVTTARADTAVDVQWQGTTQATHYEIERRVGGKSFVTVAAVDNNVRTYTDRNGLLAGEAYHYRVRALAGNNTSGYALGAPLTITFPAPSDVIVITSADTAVQVAWTYNGSFHTGFEIWQQLGADSMRLRGVAAASVRDFVDTTALLTTGNYTYHVRAVSRYNKSVFAASSPVAVNFESPSAVTVAALADTAVRVRWVYGGSSHTGFEVWQQVGTESMKLRSTVAAAVREIVDRTALVSSGRYVYFVRAVSRNNTSGFAASQPVDVGFPAPSGVTLTARADTAVRVAWTYGGTYQTGFEIWQQAGANSPKLRRTVAAAVREFVDTTALVVNVLYIYHVRAISQNNTSAFALSAPLSLNFPSPSTLTLSFTGDTAIVLRWRDNSSFETGFLIERSLDGSTFAQAAAAGAGETTKTLSGIFYTTNTYYYRVRAKSRHTASTYSNTASGTVSLPAPINVFTSAQADTAVKITWTYSGSFQTGFEVWQQMGAESPRLRRTVAAWARELVDTTALVASGNYTYQVRAISRYNTSAFTASSPLSINFAAPSSVTATAMADTAVRVAWAYSGTTHTGFEVWQQIESGSMTLRSALDAPAREFVDRTGLLADKRYTYYVRAISQHNVSAFEAGAPLTMSFAAPSGVTLTARADTAVRVAWSYGGSLQTGFELWQQVESESPKFRRTVAGALREVVDTAALVPGARYFYHVRAVSRHNASAFAVSAPLSISFASPTDLRLTFTSDTTVSLRWQDNSTFETGFLIEQSLDGATFAHAAEAGAGITTTTVAGIFRTTSTYYYRVQARSRNATSEFSNTASGTISFLAPAGVQIAALADTAVRVTWTHSGTFHTGFEVWQQVGSESMALRRAVAPTAREFVDATPLVANSSYTYHVRAVSRYNTSAFAASAPLTITTMAAPANVTASALADTAARIRWAYSGTSHTGFEVWQQADSESPVLRRTVGAQVRELIDPAALVAGRSYTYRVRAVSQSNASAFAAGAPVTVSFAAPSNVTATASADTAVRVAWAYTASFQTGFEIWRQAGSDSMRFRRAVAASAREFTDTTALVLNERYTYHVRAASRHNLSAFAASAPLTVGFDAPSNVTAAARADTAVQVAWSYGGVFHTGFEIERQVDGKEFEPRGSATLLARTFRDTSPLDIGRSYVYRVRAVSRNSASAYAESPPLSIALAAPAALEVTAIGSASVTLGWRDENSFETGVEIGRSADGMAFDIIDTVNANVTSASLPVSLDAAQSYWFRIRAVSRHNTSAYSNRIRLYSSPGLYAGGNFSAAGGEAANHVARWNGSEWSAPGPGMNDDVRALAVSAGELYAGGDFTTAGGGAANRIARWNGSGWSAAGAGVNNPIRALAVYDGAVYAGGEFTTAGGGAANRIARWNGGNWSAAGPGMNGNVHALAVYGGDLYAGGVFTTAGGAPAKHVAKWNGAGWSPAGAGTGDDVYALAVYNGELYAGGRFDSAGGAGAAGIARWDGNAWSAVDSGVQGRVSALAVYNGELYAGGEFTAAGGGAANNIARWNGSSWSAVGSGADGTVAVLAVHDGELYAGGDFTTAGGASAGRIARWNGSAWSPVGAGMNKPVYALAAFAVWQWESVP